MAGIYIHIPFCKSRCKYCDFFSTTLFDSSWIRYRQALCHEMAIRSKSFQSQLEEQNETISTLYFGGGTPSLVCEEDVKYLIDALRSDFSGNYNRENGKTNNFWQVEEITLEANPGDLTKEKMEGLRRAGINRLSIGIQSLHDPLLRRIGRRHTAAQAREAVKMAQEAGFTNISVDMMYGLPGQTLKDWTEDINAINQMGVQHVSCYCLTYEEGTPLYAALQLGEVDELDDDLLNQMQDEAERILLKSGIKRYEVSNYAVDNFYSKHNSSYWTKAPYLGLGAGAHSYDGKRHRMWNPNDLERYIQGTIAAQTEEDLPLEGETLSEDDRYNETVMLGLRTMQGVDTKAINKEYLEYFFKQAEGYLAKGWLLKEGDFIRASREGMRCLNRVIEDIMK